MDKIGRWAIRLIVIWTMAGVALRAFLTPWRWTLDQSLVAFLGVCAVAVLGLWAVIWQREGIEGVKKRWAFMQSRKKTAVLSGRLLLWNLLIWMAIAIALVFFFNAYQSH
ncbi:MAG: hypothetical protein JO256_01145 [Alphaproteobacteria bacterium]|nr:hypothetical protein [Alphaproteobacteria bacterium]